MNNEARRNRERLRCGLCVCVGGDGGVHYDSVENCTVNKLVGLSCFPSLQPPGAFVCLCVCLVVVVLLSMLDFQLHPDSPNDNAAGNGGRGS